MKRNNLLTQVFPLVLIIFLCSCATGISQKSSGKNGVQDDLSSFRPEYKAPAQNDEAEVKQSDKKDAPLNATADVTAEVNSKLEQIKANAPKVAKGYRILLYSGNKKEEATLVKDKAHMLVPDKIYLEFRAPNFRVKIGDAISRVEANYLLGKLKTDFPNAVIVPDDVNIEF
jgi:hypothetical protein